MDIMFVHAESFFANTYLGADYTWTVLQSYDWRPFVSRRFDLQLFAK